MNSLQSTMWPETLVYIHLTLLAIVLLLQYSDWNSAAEDFSAVLKVLKFYSRIKNRIAKRNKTNFFQGWRHSVNHRHAAC